MPELTNQQLAALVRQQQQPEQLSLKQLLYLCRAQWLWFIISVVVCVGGAYFYLLRTQPTYTRKASLLIKADAKGNSIGDIAGLDNMGLFHTQSKVDNELECIQSPALILELVRQMHLDVNYSVKGLLRSKPLYGPTLPVTVDFLEMNDSDFASFHLDFADNKFTLSKLTYNDDELEGEITANLGDTIDSPYGKLLVAPTTYYESLTNPEDELAKPIRGCEVSRSSIYNTQNSVSTRLKAAFTSKTTTVIDLTFTDTNIARAEEVLSTLITLYNQSWINDKNQIAVSTSRFINERLGVIEQELGHVDSDISQYKSENLIPDINAASHLYMQQATAANNEIQQLNNQLYMTRSLRSYAQNEANRFQLLPANSGVNSPNVEALISAYNQKMLARNNLVANSSVNHPLVVDADKELFEMRNNVLHSIDSHIAALNAQIQTQDRLARQSTAGIASNPLRAKDLLSVERQQKVKEALYLFLLQKREENELSQAFTAYNTRMITPPMGPIRPTSPVGSKVLLIGLLLGLAIPVIIIYLLEVGYTKVRGRKDIEKLTAPFIGELPLAEQKRAKTKRQQLEQRYTIQVKDKGTDIINEAFRIIRSNVEYINMPGTTNQHPRVIMTTSANPGSGKTFISMNLAASFALKGKRVIVLDLDLRRRSLSRYVSRPKTGIVDYLHGDSDDWRPFVFDVSEHKGLSVIPVGHIPPNPSELLYSPRLEQLIDELRQEYDYVFLDSPPVDMVADTSIIAKFAELTLFVIRIGIMERDHLKVVEDYYTQKKLPNMTILLNGAEQSSRYGYHRYGSGYGYGYGYGYGNYNEKRK